MAHTTYDGLPISEEPPHGASVVVRSQSPGGTRFLLLHRAHHGPDYEGEWAWTPPSGARQPGEGVREAALRELAEEAGPHIAALGDLMSALPGGNGEWARFLLEVPWGTPVDLIDAEHDRWEWMTLEEALRRCLPDQVADTIRCASTMPAAT
jgi:8-oxo-dGTP pyrophosphatase MutT (NUDIX family)